MKFSLPTHPESPHGLLRRSFDLYQHAWSHVFFLSLLLSITVFLPSLFSLAASEDIFNNLPLYSINRLWLFVLNLGALTFFVAILWRLHCLMIHKHESLEEDLRISLLKVPSIFIASLVQAMFIGSIIILLSAFTYHVVLGRQLDISQFNWKSYLAIFLFFVQLLMVFFIVLSFYFYLALIVLENKGVFTSLAKSFRLVWKHWWTTFYVQSIPWLSYLLFLIFVKFVINLNINIFFINKVNTQNLVDVILNILIFASFIPWIAITLMVQLKDLELRRMSRFKRVEDEDYPAK